jgi:hypothetical protein
LDTTTWIDPPSEYGQTVPPEEAGEVYRRVWRTTLDEPGFALVRFTAPAPSRSLRVAMFELAWRLGEAAGAEGRPRFVPERLGRFDQQVSSRFHRDGAPPASLLILGYEPTTVRSHVFVADAHRAALDAGLGIREYLAAFNPMFPAGEGRLRPFVTAVPVPHGEAHVLVINNSLLSLEPGVSNPLGVLHKAVIPEADPSASRVINSMGLMLEGDPSAAPKLPAAVEHFLTRTDLD